MGVGVYFVAGPKRLTGAFSFFTAESATYCLVKNAVKMFKDIGVSVPCLWYKRVCSRLSSFHLDLVYVRHLCVGLNPGRSSFYWINHAGISGGWEKKGHVEGEVHQHRFI